MNDQDFLKNNAPKPTGGPRNFLILLAVVAAASMGFASMMQYLAPKPNGRTFDKSPFVGTKLPKIDATGWINGDPVTEDDLKGKVIVLDVWAYWCGPCVMEARHLVQVQKKFADNPDVIFIGATGEPASSNSRSNQFISHTGITWPNAVGVFHLLETLEIQSIPAVFVTNKKGIIIWTRHSAEPIEQAIERGLKE